MKRTKLPSASVKATILVVKPLLNLLWLGFQFLPSALPVAANLGDPAVHQRCFSGTMKQVRRWLLERRTRPAETATQRLQAPPAAAPTSLSLVSTTAFAETIVVVPPACGGRILITTAPLQSRVCCKTTRRLRRLTSAGGSAGSSAVAAVARRPSPASSPPLMQG